MRARPPTPVRPAESVPYDGSQKALVDRVSSYLSNVQTLIGDFVQIGPAGATPLTSSASDYRGTTRSGGNVAYIARTTSDT